MESQCADAALVGNEHIGGIAGPASHAKEHGLAILGGEATTTGDGLGDDALGLQACSNQGAAATEEKINGAAVAYLAAAAAELDVGCCTTAISTDVTAATTNGLGDHCRRGDACGLNAGVGLGGEADVTRAGVTDDGTAEVHRCGGGVGNTATATNGLKD